MGRTRGDTRRGIQDGWDGDEPLGDAEGLRMSDDREDGGTTDERDVKTVLFSSVFICFVK